MERKIGETFEFEGKTLQVKEIEKHTCKGCFFGNGCDKELHIKVTGDCFDRTDGNDVIFIPIEEEQKLNLCEVLKYCPEGTQFWSPMLGDVKFWGVGESMVTVEDKAGNFWDINSDGTLTIGGVGGVTSEEPMLFPSREQRDWTKVKYEPKKELPKTWEEFCQQNPTLKLEYFIDDSSCVRKAKSEGDIRHKKYDRNTLPSREAAEAHLALMQLHQLRDVWREGWVPDWNDGDQNKYVIAPNEGEFMTYKYHTISRFLAFQDKKRADKFRNCFIDLIRKAGDLI